MIGIEWARISKFNWCFDNMGGTPLQAPVCGLWSDATFTVQDNRIVIPDASGGGKVYYFRGVWETSTFFAWGGFWTKPEGSTTNYYTGGSFQNVGNETIVTLGTPLPDGAVVQAYYIYNTGEKAVKYEALNSTPCIRRAWRSATDYTYDYAVDRIFDAMAAVWFAARERGQDDEDIIRFLWDSYLVHAASNPNPLVFDDFSRDAYDQGSYLLYGNSTQGKLGLDHFGIELPPDDYTLGRSLRFKPKYYLGPEFSAWCGYGFNWSLAYPYFEDISKVKFTLRGANAPSRVQKFVKSAGTGAAKMIVIDEYKLNTTRYYYLEVIEGGWPGTARALLKVLDQEYKLINDADPEDQIEGEIVICQGKTSPTLLGYGIKAYWEGGQLAVGDAWYVTGGNQVIYPHRLQVCLNDSLPSDPDPWGESHTYVHGVCDYYPENRTFEIGWSQFWRLGNIIDCRDRRPGRWGSWTHHAFQLGYPYEVLYYDVAEEFEVNGEQFYTRQRFTWNLDQVTIRNLGFWLAIPGEVSSTGRSSLNFLARQENGQAIVLRTKVRDANGHYFYQDATVPANVWTRVTLPLSGFVYEGSVFPTPTLTHPLTLVDIGMSYGNLIPQGHFELADLKFDDHVTFTGSQNLRVVEFKHQEAPLKLSNGPDWYLDDFGFDLAVDDPYPYAPRLAVSLNAYGRNPWRGPTLVHYSHPLAPFLVDRLDIKQTELALHYQAQAEFNARYGGLPGPIMPVHTRNDIENIPLCGEANFNKFCWWPDYPEAGHALGQYWAFCRLAEYFFASSDTGAWEILDRWLTWLDAYVAADGPGWIFPIWFGDQFESGFEHDTENYDPGAAASIVVGCLYIYMRNGDPRALSLAQKLLADLRVNRTSGEFGGYLYKTDYHYAWMNALVAHAFGLAIVGRAGAAYRYPYEAVDETHFQNIMNNFWLMSGDSKPNLLNSDLIPFHEVEASDIWDYAPNYLFMKEMGSMEAVVLMLHTALDWALYDGSYSWFNSLLEFMFRLGKGTLETNQVYQVSSNFMTSNLVNKVNLSYGDYRRDHTLYVEAGDPAMAELLGEKRQHLALHYGSPVITEDANTAAKIASRYLEYFATPKEQVQVAADLSAARFEFGDIVQVDSPFHGLMRDKFQLTRRLYDKRKHRVVLDLMRPARYSPSFAVNAAGGAFDSYAIQADSEFDEDWGLRAFAN